MEKIILVRGIALLSSAFPANKFNADFYWELLNDIEDQDFHVAIIKIIKNLKEIYPGTNLIAMIRDKANENKKERINKVVVIPNMECAPPPKEWLEAKEKLKVSNDAK